MDVSGGFNVDPAHTAAPLEDLLRVGLGEFPQHVMLTLRSDQGGSDTYGRHVSCVTDTCMDWCIHYTVTMEFTNVNTIFFNMLKFLENRLTRIIFDCTNYFLYT